MNRAKKPWENGQQYMEVLNYAEIGACKRECRSMKAEAALTKAEAALTKAEAALTKAEGR